MYSRLCSCFPLASGILKMRRFDSCCKENHLKTLKTKNNSSNYYRFSLLNSHAGFTFWANTKFKITSNQYTIRISSPAKGIYSSFPPTTTYVRVRLANYIRNTTLSGSMFKSFQVRESDSTSNSANQLRLVGFPYIPVTVVYTSFRWVAWFSQDAICFQQERKSPSFN